jgi:hypothetical protein
VAPPFDRRHDDRLGACLAALTSAALDTADVRLIGFHEPVQPGLGLGFRKERGLINMFEPKLF